MLLKISSVHYEKSLEYFDEIYLIPRSQTIIVAAVVSLVCVWSNLFQNILTFWAGVLYMERFPYFTWVHC